MSKQTQGYNQLLGFLALSKLRPLIIYPSVGLNEEYLFRSLIKVLSYLFGLHCRRFNSHCKYVIYLFIIDTWSSYLDWLQGVIVSFNCSGSMLFAIVMSQNAYKGKAHRMKRKIISLNNIGSTLWLMAEHHYKRLYTENHQRKSYVWAFSYGGSFLGSAFLDWESPTWGLSPASLAW